MDTKKLRGTLIGDYEVSGAVDNVWIDTSNPNKVLTKVFIKDKWKSIADSASTEEAIAYAEQGLAGKTDKVSDAVNGNLAALDDSGNLTDSGKNVSDFLDAATNTGSDGQMLAYTANGPMWAPVPEGSVTIDPAMSDSSTNAIQNRVVKAYVDLKADKTALDNYALKTGSYDTLTAGMAKNIEGQSTNEGTYLERPTAYPTDVATGVAPVEQIKGHSVVWKQIIMNGNFANSNYWSAYGSATFTVSEGVATVNITATSSDTAAVFMQTSQPYVAGHKYLFIVDLKSNNTATEVNIIPTNSSNDGQLGYTYYASWTHVTYLWTRQGTGTTLTIKGRNNLDNTKDVDFSVKNVVGFDLTLIFGAGNEPATTAAFEEWLEQNVGLKPYYAYDAGSILNNKLTGFKTIGRNLLNPTTKTARLLSYEYGDNDNKFCIKNLPTGATLSFTPDATGVAETVTPDSNGIFTISGTGTLTVTTDSSLADTYVCFVWDGTMNDEPVAYEDHTYDFDVTKIYGQLNGAGDYVQVYPNGMLSAGSVKDVLTKDSAVVNVGRVNMGDLTWTTTNYTESAGWRIYTVTLNNPPSTIQKKAIGLNNLLCSTYPNAGVGDSLMRDKSITGNPASKVVYIKDSYYSAQGANALVTSLSGVYLNYELDTPLVYTNLVYRDNGVDTPLSEIFPINMLVDNWSTEQALVTAYSSNAPTSCAPVVETLYGLDVAEMLDSYEHGEFPSKASIDNLASTLAALIGYTYDPTKKVWDDGHWNFGATGCFTANSNFLTAGTGASGTWSVSDNTIILTPTE